MDFHAYAARNKRKSIYFTFASFALLGVLIAAGAFYLMSDVVSSLIVGVVASTVVVTVLAFNASRIALTLAKAQAVGPEQAPGLVNVVEEVSLAAGLPMPQVYVVDDPALNAFAVGSDTDGHVAFTTGLLGALTRDQLQGVAAHEVSHLKNGDSKLMTIVAGVGLAIGFVAEIGGRMMFFGNRRSSSNNPAAAVLSLVIMLLAIVLAPVLAMMVQAAVSREREWLADSTAVDLTRNPAGLRSALEVLGGSATKPAASSSSTSHLWIAEPLSMKEVEAKRGKQKKSLFSTHPPLEERVGRLRKLESLFPM